MWQAYQAGGWYGVGNVKGGRVADAALMVGSAGVGAGVSAVVVRAFNIPRITQIGRLRPINKSGRGYFGVQYARKARSGRYRVRSIEIHPPHRGHGFHWQRNVWSGRSISSKKTRRTSFWTPWRLFK